MKTQRYKEEFLDRCAVAALTFYETENEKTEERESRRHPHALGADKFLLVSETR